MYRTSRAIKSTYRVSDADLKKAQKEMDMREAFRRAAQIMSLTSQDLDMDSRPNASGWEKIAEQSEWARKHY